MKPSEIHETKSCEEKISLAEEFDSKIKLNRARELLIAS